MRKLNTILSVLLLFICLLHGLMGSFMLLGISSGAGKFLAWIGVGILAAHVLGLLLTAQIFRASRYGGKPYGKQNALFWARRASGLAILLMLFFHIGVFGKVQNGVYILFPFTTVRLLTQLFYWSLRYLCIFCSISGLFWYRWALSGIRNSAATSI